LLERAANKSKPKDLEGLKLAGWDNSLGNSGRESYQEEKLKGRLSEPNE